MTVGIAYARAGLLGNPSDGYFGKVIAISVKNFAARVILEPSPELRILGAAEDEDRYASPSAFLERLDLYGYYGGVRLVKAALKKFMEYCRASRIVIPSGNFSIRYESSIPRQLGLGGSSAIITAAFRAFMAFTGIDIPLEIQPSLILSAEREELEINAGFMDRVTQVYEGCVYMDFDRRILQEHGHGTYERLDPKLLPDLYLAYKPSLGKVSGRVLNEIRSNYDKGDPETIQTLAEIAALAEEGKRALLRGDKGVLFDLMNENFDLRRKIMTITPANLVMIATARRCGASSKFAGSGGSIIGMYRDDDIYARLEKELAELGAVVVKPIIV
jgi:glucuronokinase